MNGYGSMSRGLSTYTELLACLAFSRHAQDIAVPLPFGTAWVGFDLLVRLERTLEYCRVQVKSAHVKGGRVGVRTLKRDKHHTTDLKRPYEGHEFDWLLAVQADTGVMWLLPMSEVAGKRYVLLSGRVPWIGKLELPTLHEMVVLSRLLKARAEASQGPTQQSLPLEQEPPAQEILQDALFAE